MVADDPIKNGVAGLFAADDTPEGASVGSEVPAPASAAEGVPSAIGGGSPVEEEPPQTEPCETAMLSPASTDDGGQPDDDSLIAAAAGDDDAAADEVGDGEEASGPTEGSVTSKTVDSQEPDNTDDAGPARDWYILKVQVNREDTIRAALLRRIKIEGLEQFFDEIVVPTEDVVEFNKSGKKKVVRRKLYPGYILVHMVVNDETWFLVRETPGVGDFTGSSGKPTPMSPKDVERILRLGVAQEAGSGQLKTAIPFKVGDRVRVKDGHFQNFEGEVDSIDEANGRITVMINIFNRSTPVELEHWQVESV